MDAFGPRPVVADPPKLLSVAHVSPRRVPSHGRPRKTILSSNSAFKRGFTPSKPSLPRLAINKQRPAPTVRPLVPVTERRSSEEKIAKAALVKDGSSTGRQGRQFAVSNVGNNGRIYLSTGGLDGLGPQQLTSRDEEAVDDAVGQWTPTPSSSPLTGELHQLLLGSRSTPRPTRQRRAMSDSTVGDLGAAANDADGEAFRVVIARPGLDKRPWTMEDFNSASTPLLHVDIPSWRIGTPRFTLRGTPIIRGSSYAPSEELVFSRALAGNENEKKHGPPAPSGSPSSPSPGQLLPSANAPPPLRSSVIEPAMFTALTFKPACDDPSVVRYSPNGNVQAATPPRLVAEITSPSFLDYELISDFFLTFRTFLDPTDLLRMLMARLRWALGREDEVGMIVRVRTFVAVRHWILNYFLDDFVFDHGLRVTFCRLLNEVVDGLPPDESYRKVRLKILAELKKCWRRVCAEYWDGPQFGDSLSPEDPIAPGGLVGSRDPDLEPGFWERQGIEPPRPEALVAAPKMSTQSASLYVDACRTAPMSDFVVPGDRPGTPDEVAVVGSAAAGLPNSPLSLASMDVFSCSFPAKTSKPKTSSHSTPHPVPLTMPTASGGAGGGGGGGGQVATTPKALVGKRVRPLVVHKRHNSTSDSLRERGSDKSSSHDVDSAAIRPSAGSLLRGNVLPPGQPFVECELNRQTTLFQPDDRRLPKDKAAAAAAGAMTSRGMKKLLGSVRRALRSRAQGVSPWQNQPGGMPPVAQAADEAATSRMPGTAVVPQGPPRQNGSRPPVRIDLLGAEVAEDFRKAIREEEAEAEAERLGLGVPPNSAPPSGGPTDYSAAHLEFSSFDGLPQDQRPRPVSDTGITGGSKSIVIVDDTTARDVMMAQGPSHAGPTPPDTPRLASASPRPWQTLRALGENASGPAPASEAPSPPALPDSFTAVGGRGSDERDTERPPIGSGGSTFRTSRQDSWTDGFPQSLDSMMQHLPSMLQGGSSLPEPPPPSPWFFDSQVDDGFDVPEPAPLRVLRRRPGGDLRAAVNVGDLDRASSLRPSLSVGSLAAYTESVRSSYLLSTRPNSAGSHSVADPARDGRREVLSLGRLAEEPANAHLSVYNSHASKPPLRPSFEMEAQKLAQIPDEDDGGIESALLKLEGKYERRPSTVPMLCPDANVGETRPEDEGRSDESGDSRQSTIKRKENRQVQVVDEPMVMGDGGEHEKRAARKAKQELGRKMAPDVKSFLSEGSQESYYSIPLLERGLSEGSRSKAASLLRNSVDAAASEHRLSFDMVEMTESLERVQAEERERVGDDSFLYDDEMELSSALSVSSRHQDSRATTGGDGGQEGAATVHALQTPPLSGKVGGAEAAAPAPSPAPRALLPTPELSPAPPECQAWTTPHAGGAETRLGSVRNYSVHLPFILAFDSDTVAQQLTLIEKDALKDIDWKEIMGMQWKDAVSNDVRSWVDFLRHRDAQGIEVVVARFNLMVKWAISEIMLTQRIEERARCIVKLIHIASHCRRYRNFASLVQLTIALSSGEVTRLRKTWALVPSHESETLQSLERLVTPLRNFHAIRAEMETGSDAGCIPFVGVYTHDLLYNSQRPSRGGEGLIDFERCRVAAGVAKTLLRLLEASTRYSLRPVEGLTERCLWIGALTDEEIRERSTLLE
ncbi:Ras guanine nucleotide exchange factor [Ophiocordyceps camponoti-floridani]|uniref:Ras guanine nucleotide exchange factor n=1 Tax=Ophiocordyceps camponoti-floridani TaxID=2030778 RepID=A0A8H4Q408_9HYPO|nr:Ras guanine nucleotide exchange factor [Ophiocordyceps camponoti-floridani]